MRNRRLTVRFPVAGVNKRTAFQTQPPYTAYAASNVWPDNVSDGRERGGVRPGLSTAVTGTLPGPIRMLHEINVQTETGSESVLVCSAGGNFYRRNSTTGAWGSAISTSYTLATDRLIQAAVFGEKLYIADYGIAASGLDLQVSAGSSTVVHLPELESGTDGVLDATGLVFTSAGSTFVTNSVTAGVDVLRLTDTGTGAAVVGVYEIASVDSETQLTLAATAGTTATGVDFVVRPSLANEGVTVDDHGLEVLEAGAGTAAFYTINSISEDQITLASSPGATSTTGIHYRFHRTPKVWDLATDSIDKWEADNGGELPLSCSVICYFQDRIVLAGAPSYPNVWYASKQGDPHDFDFDGDTTDSAVAGTSFTNGQIGDPITALIPHNRQCLVIGAQDSLYVMRGDPNSPSSTIDQISAHLGPISPQAWCKDEKFRTWMLTRDGLYVMADGCGDVPQSFSREKIPDALLNLPAGDYIPQLKYDQLQRAVQVHVPMRTVGASVGDGVGSGSTITTASVSDWSLYNVQVGDFVRITSLYIGGETPATIIGGQFQEITAIDGNELTIDTSDFDTDTNITFRIYPSETASNQSYWLDTERGGVWPMVYSDDYYPSVLCEYPEVTTADKSPVILGGVDGVARQHDRSATTDSGTAFTGSVTIGPFPLARSTFERAVVRSMRVLPTNDTVSMNYEIVAAESAETAAIHFNTGFASGTSQYPTIDGVNARTYSLVAGYPQTQHPRAAGVAGAIQLSGTGSTAWGLEQIDLEVFEAGRLR